MAKKNDQFLTDTDTAYILSEKKTQVWSFSREKHDIYFENIKNVESKTFLVQLTKSDSYWSRIINVRLIEAFVVSLRILGPESFSGNDSVVILWVCAACYNSIAEAENDSHDTFVAKSLKNVSQQEHKVE